MKIVAVIPARYNSTRFVGKPLADICGKPMIWWVYQQVTKVKEFDAVYVATDDERIKKYCDENGINVLMTSDKHENHIYRIHEVTTMVESDYYVCVNGDEPMIEPDTIKQILQPIYYNENFWAINLMTTIKDPAQVVDFAKIKIITDEHGYGIYMSRSPIPYPRGSSQFEYKKYVGVECMTKEALDFFVNTRRSNLENIEDIDHLRFIENRKKIKFVNVNSDTLSVDTPKDLEKVISIIREHQ
jgi:3-deoxy-manno-octulosonate cytidylyltransferase (CMP-KDO synthetase)